MGRTGKMFASGHFDVFARYCHARQGYCERSAAGGQPSHAQMLMTWPPGAHASTFGGNPVSIAAALTTIELLEEELLANAAQTGARCSTA